MYLSGVGVCLHKGSDVLGMYVCLDVFLRIWISFDMFGCIWAWVYLIYIYIYECLRYIWEYLDIYLKWLCAVEYMLLARGSPITAPVTVRGAWAGSGVGPPP